MSDDREEWSRRIDAAQTVEDLEQIEAILLAHEASWVGPMRFKIANRKRLLRQAAPKTVPLVAAPMAQVRPRNAPQPIAADYGLPAPDGRRLHAYRLSGENFHALQARLARLGGYDTFATGYYPGLFVLWASEWFRRSWTGGARRWEDLTAVLRLPSPGQTEQHTLRALTEKGLRQWKRPVFEHGNRYYLATIAREGGFPAAAVAEGTRGSARQMLEAIIGPLMGSPASGEEDALQLAVDAKRMMPPIFADDDFAQLCADLALSIVQIRREAEPLANAAGIPLTAWLALNRPDWRGALPLSTTDAAADALVETLLQVEAVTGNLVGVDRLLSRDENRNWLESVRLRLDGLVSGNQMRLLDVNSGRLRAFGAGSMARHIPGELALFDPPVDDEEGWLSRSARRSRAIMPLPFDISVQLDLRAGEQIMSRIELPSGKAKRGQMLVFSLEGGSAETPDLLRLIGSGSGRYRSREVYIQVPEAWGVTADAGEAVSCLGAGSLREDGASKLWRVEGGATVLDCDGDTYRIRCGQPADESRKLELFGNGVGWAELSGAVDLYRGAPTVARSGSGEIVWRQLGTRGWQPAPTPLPEGFYELGWRHAGEMVDRRKIAVLPPSARLHRNHGGHLPPFELSGFGPVSVVPLPDAPVAMGATGATWQLRPNAPLVRRFQARISWPGAPSLEVGIEYPGEACITRWDGSILANRSILTLSEFRDLVARVEGEGVLLAELRDPIARDRPRVSWNFRDELPLSAIADDVASLLLPSGLDAEVVLEMNSGMTSWRVRQFPMKLTPEGDGFVADLAIADPDVALYGRSIANPFIERNFGPYSLLSASNHRPACLPADILGDWLVFLRQGERVLTRPFYRKGDGNEQPVGALGTAMVQPFAVLEDQLREILGKVGADTLNDVSGLDEVIALVDSLNGLPPVTFQVLKLLPEFPATLARMAFAANSDQRDNIMELAESFPFAWYLLPKAAWDSARGALFASVHAQLESLGDKASQYALQSVELTARALVDIEPLLTPVLAPPKESEPIADIAMRFLQRGAIDRVSGPSRGRYRAVPNVSLPERFLDFDICVLDTLDAPCIAAEAVRGRWKPTPDDVRQIKLAARNFPTWFSEAFAASLAGA